MALNPVPLIAHDGTLCWACPVDKDHFPIIKSMLKNERFRAEYLDNGNMYVTDSILHTNGYMMRFDTVIRFNDGTALALTDKILEREFRPAGTFCNYEEDPRDG